uniref:Golgin candidate 6 n=1 Tax=Anthurium amnicola TaxID=1678845 RepID=A0A1D1XF58_9ARAE
MDFKFGRINLNAVAQGVGGLVFGNENSASNEDSYVERLLHRISNGVLADDRRAAMTELQSLVAESRQAQLAFGAMGLPVILSVLKEERDDVEMVRGALETLVSGMTPIDTSHAMKNEVQPASMNSDLLSRESDNISLILNLLSEDDFYIRYYTLQLLTALLTNSPHRLQEAILSVPRGITRLMDMLMDREVIRNEALLLLTYLTREAEEIQKIVVFEGAFEKIFSIIKEEGGSEGGVVVQDCLELLNNLIRNTASNQILLRETIGFEPLVSILKLHRGSAYNFTQQKTVNLLSALETVELLLVGGPDGEPGKDANRLSNQTVLAQKKILDHLLMLGVESQWASLAVRCSALRGIGNLVLRNPQNLDALANKTVGEEPHIEPALNSILRIILRTSTLQEFIAADHVFKSFCEGNRSGQAMLASSMTPPPHTVPHASLEDSSNMSFGSILLRGLIFNETDGDLEICCRAVSVLFHILKDNIQSKERVLRIDLDIPVPSFGSQEPLLHRIVKYLALITSAKSKDDDQSRMTSSVNSYITPIILRLLVTWLADFSDAVHCFLDSSAHLSYLLELVSSAHITTYVRGLASMILGECVIYNKRSGENKDAYAVVDTISQKIGLTSYFLNFDELRKSLNGISGVSVPQRKPLTRCSAASTADAKENENDGTDQKPEHPILLAIFDVQFIDFVKRLEADIREGIVEVFSHPKNKVVIVPAELEQKDGEADGDYIKRLKLFVEKQCIEMQNLLARNATLAEDLAKTGGGADAVQKPISGRERVLSENLQQDLQEAARKVETMKSEKAKLEADSIVYKNLVEKLESDLKSLSDAYGSLEQANFQLDAQVKALRKGGEPYPDVEAIRAQAREEAEKESETELNDLLVCLGQEQSKVEKLSTRLAELGEDVDLLLDGIGDDAALPEDDE